jgi:hypothetical protein
MRHQTLDRNSLAERFASLQRVQMDGEMMDIIPHLRELDAFEEDLSEYIKINQDSEVRPGEDLDLAQQRIKDEIVSAAAGYL